MNKLITLLLILNVGVSCSRDTKPACWPANSSIITSVAFELNISDTSKILTKQGDGFFLINITDSLISKYDTIFYNIPDRSINKYFPGLTIETVRTYSSNPSVKEFYAFDKGAVKLAGYITGDSLMPVTVFSNPLVIFPKPGISVDSTLAIKKNWVSNDNAFKDDTKTRTIVKLLKTGVLLFGNNREDFYLYQLTLAGEAKIAFGEKELLLPDAIYMESYMVIGITSGLICEWSVKTKRATDVMNDPARQQGATRYIEFIKYRLVSK